MGAGFVCQNAQSIMGTPGEELGKAKWCKLPPCGSPGSPSLGWGRWGQFWVNDDALGRKPCWEERCPPACVPPGVKLILPGIKHVGRAIDHHRAHPQCHASLPWCPSSWVICRGWEYRRFSQTLSLTQMCELVLYDCPMYIIIYDYSSTQGVACLLFANHAVLKHLRWH